MVFHICTCRNKYTRTFNNGLWFHGEPNEVSHGHDSIIFLAHGIVKSLFVTQCLKMSDKQDSYASSKSSSEAVNIDVCAKIQLRRQTERRSIGAPFSFARPLSWEHCPPSLISIPYALRQHNLNSTSVQNSVIICLFKKFCVNFFYCYVLVLFKSLRLSLFKCILICFVFFYNCSGNLSVGPSFRPFHQGFAKYSRSRAVIFFLYLCFFLNKLFAPFNVPFSWAFLKRRVTCRCVTYKG